MRRDYNSVDKVDGLSGRVPIMHQRFCNTLLILQWKGAGRPAAVQVKVGNGVLVYACAGRVF